MNTEFRRAVVPEEIRSLVIFDRKVFREYPADWFDREAWSTYDSWWMIINNRKAGCCAFATHQDFQEDIREDGRNTNVAGSLYIVTTGILPALRGGDSGACSNSGNLRMRGTMDSPGL